MKVNYRSLLIPALGLALAGCGAKGGNEDGGGHLRPLSSVAKEHGMVIKVDPKTRAFQMGYTDPLFIIRPGESGIQTGEHYIPLKDAPQLRNGELYLSRDAVERMFNDPSLYAGGGSVGIASADGWDGWTGMIDGAWNSPWTPVQPPAEGVGQVPVQSTVPMPAQTPAQAPAGTPAWTAPPASPAPARTGAPTAGQTTAPTASPVPATRSGIDPAGLITFGKTFLGTPYRFAAGPYEDQHVFDCSSFTQYVYGHYGIKLPRASKDQAQVGQLLRMNELQPGDMMFFYTPGRYESNRIVGHVGIYMGNDEILHTYGSPGVVVSGFNSYWKGRFLHGRRVL